MSHVLIIIAFASLRMLPPPGERPWRSFDLDPLVSLLVAVVPMLALVSAASLVTSASMKRLDRTGRTNLIDAAESLAALGGTAATLWFVGAVGFFGWLDTVRLVTGDVIVLDEVIALVPLLLAYFGLAVARHPIDKRRGDAVLVRALDRGEPIYPVPPAMAAAWRTLRHGALTVAIPLAMIFAIGEGIDRGATHLYKTSKPGDWIARPGVLETVVPLAQLLGAVSILAIAPVALRIIWDTVRVPPGDLRDRLEALCERHNVRVAEHLIWRTGGTMLNAAVAGLLAPLRFIVISDALLERLGEREVEAVAAHEVAHVRLGHMAWLAAAVLGSITLAGGVVGLALRFTVPGFVETDVGQGVIVAAVIAAAIFGLGHASRRFERQADAFAVKHLSGAVRGGASVPVTAAAIGAMCGALRTVGRHNGVRLRKFTWRHGSLAGRIEALQALEGLPSDRLPIDAAARWVKGLALTALVVGVGLTVLDEFLRISAQTAQLAG
ncbi:MAG: M48 family metallopeptidase [Planctomycetota bacterium]